LDLSTRRIIISHHVVFDELNFPFARDSSTPTGSFDFLVSRGLDTAPCSTDHDHAAGGRSLGGSGSAPPPSPDVSPPGGCGFVPLPGAVGVSPSGTSAATSPGECGFVPPPGPLDDPAAAGSPGGCGFVPPSGPLDGVSTPAPLADLPGRFKGAVYERRPAAPTVPPPPSPGSPSTSPVVRRQTRLQTGTIAPVNYRNLTADHVVASPIPANYRSALADPNWRAAMADEFQALTDNGTWRLVPRPSGANVVTGK